MDNYDYFEPTVENSFFADIDKVFFEKYDVTFAELDKYSDEKVHEVIEEERAKVSENEWEKLNAKYSPTKIKTYLILGRIEELIKSPAETEEAPSYHEQSADQNIKNIVDELFAAPAQGFSSVSTQIPEENLERFNSTKHRKHQKRAYSELFDRKKQEIGMVGEVCVYKELLALYPDARWVSGNAEKAGHAIKGDDTCGYDIKYTDPEGMIQYVEVKASRNEEITFLLSDSELRFGCNNASNYEIIYVVVGEDGKPAHKPWRLGHIFDFAEDEDLFYNDRFSIENDSYRIVATPVEDKKVMVQEMKVLYE